MQVPVALASKSEQYCRRETEAFKYLSTHLCVALTLPHTCACLQAPDPRLAVLEGPVFRALVLRPDGSTDLDAFAALWPHMRVMARCTPADKYTLVQVRTRQAQTAESTQGILLRGAGVTRVCQMQQVNHLPNS